MIKHAFYSYLSFTMHSRDTSPPLRPTHIKALGDIAWGTHGCLLYESPEGLTEIIVNFLQAGIESNESCLWVTSGAASREMVERGLCEAGAAKNSGIQKGRIDIRQASEYYGMANAFDPDTAVHAWLKYVENAVETGYDGLRLVIEPFLPATMGTRITAGYESLFDRLLNDHPIIALCIYPLSECSPSDIVHLNNHHEYTLISDRGNLEIAFNSRRQELKAVRDLSERKTAELILEKQQQELSAIYENTPNPMLLVDKDWKIRKANAASVKIAGRSRNELVGIGCGDALHCIHATDDPRGCGYGDACRQCVIRNTIQDTFRSGTSRKQIAAEMRLGKEGRSESYHYMISTIPLELGERLVLVCLEDVTELKRTLNSLRESEARLRSIFQSAPVGIGTLTPGTNNSRITTRVIRDANERFCRMTGYTEVEVRGMEVRALYESQAEYERVGSELYSQVRETGTGSVESRLKCKDESLINIQVSVAPLNPQAWSEGLNFVIMDMTQLKRAKAEQQNLEIQLRQSQKIEAIGQLTGGIAHDFNNLLQIINGYGDLIQDELEADHRALPALKEILNAGNRAANLVRQMLAFSRQQIMNMDYIHLNDLIRNLLQMIQRIIGEHIEFEFIQGHSLGLVRADAGQIEQVIINLCINARDAMPEGGRLTIETSNVFINGNYCSTHIDSPPGRYVLICITDNGVGMDANIQSRIFDPFFTTKSVGQGTGLGLSTAYGIIRQHEGTINVYSEPGCGTLFKIYLPIAERQATEVGHEIPAKTRGGYETILIAEDDQTVRELMQTTLERAGYTTYTAENGEAAIDTVKAWKDEIDLAILDVVMPKQSGKAVFDQILKIKPSMAVLFASGYNENAIHTNFILEGGMEMLQKPFASEDLLGKIRKILDRPK